MKIYQIKSKQVLPMTLDNSWNFFSDPKNLPKITPPWLNLRITSDLPDKMYEGMIITYKVYPDGDYGKSFFFNLVGQLFYFAPVKQQFPGAQRV